MIDDAVALSDSTQKVFVLDERFFLWWWCRFPDMVQSLVHGVFVFACGCPLRGVAPPPWPWCSKSVSAWPVPVFGEVDAGPLAR